jgi:hypothetical protein
MICTLHVWVEVSTHQTSLTPPLYIEVYASSRQQSKGSCMCIRRIHVDCFYDWPLNLFRRCGIFSFSFDQHLVFRFCIIRKTLGNDISCELVDDMSLDNNLIMCSRCGHLVIPNKTFTNNTNNWRLQISF